MYAKRRRGYAQRDGYGGRYTPTADPRHVIDNTGDLHEHGTTTVDLDPSQERDIYFRYLPVSIQQFLLYEAEVNWNSKDLYDAHSRMGVPWPVIDQHVRWQDRREYQLAYPDMGVGNPFTPFVPPKPQYDVLW